MSSCPRKEWVTGFIQAGSIESFSNPVLDSRMLILEKH